jgi:hypothetical protein
VTDVSVASVQQSPAVLDLATSARPDVFTLTVRRERLDGGVQFSAGAAGGTDRGLPEPGTDAGHFASHGADASGAPR